MTGNTPFGEGTAQERAQNDRRRPDADSRARTHLANERTFLAWLRTGIGLMVLGVGAAQFLEADQGLIPGIRAVSDFAAFLIVGGTLIVIVGAMRYTRGRAQIDQAEFRPAGRSVTMATVSVAVVGVLSLILEYLLGGQS